MKKFHLILTALCSILFNVDQTSGNDAHSQTIVLDETAMRNLRIEFESAETRKFERTLFAIGRIEEIPSNRSVLSSRIAGRISDLYVFEGDLVSEGQILAKVESRQLGDPPPGVALYAPQSGMVVASHIRLGQPVDPNEELMDIADRSRLWAIAKIPEREAASIRVGTKARIQVPSNGQPATEVELKRFGIEADRQSGTVDGVFEIDNADGNLRPGLRVEFSIILDSRENVLSIPLTAVQGDPANRVLFVRHPVHEDTFTSVPVVLGMENDLFVEVLEGLQKGDVVATRGSYAMSFMGGSSGISLKETLDAAHGHNHNADGSELEADDHDHAGHSDEEIHEHAEDSDEDHEDENIHLHNDENEKNASDSIWMWAVSLYAVSITIVCAVFIQKRRKHQLEGGDSGC